VKTLALLRHAKSSWDDASLDDHDRPLTRRGERAARRVGTWLAGSGAAPDLVLCSSARRAVDTLGGVLARLDREPRVCTEDALYATDPEGLLARIRSVEDAVDSLLLVGHDPAIGALAARLAAPGDSPALRRLEEKFPTGACALFRFAAGRWRDVAEREGELVAFVTPRDLA
jgi:phosphohistidine phosphatase